ncbi:MAG: winged helix-turn-helix transcriptional regulator [Theionarchaea archaeon]|nr:winged helix-turn-helix transcriptional regulator [Theionarchaea archaeon]
MINRTGKTKYKDLSSIKISVSTLNARLLEFMNFGLVKHFAIRNAKQRKEWYEITEKGKIVLKILEQLTQLIEK